MLTLLDLHDKYTHLLQWVGLLSVYHYYGEVDKLNKMQRALSEFLLLLEEHRSQVQGSDYINDLEVMIDNIQIIRNHVQEHYKQLIEV
jgi:hypothetical protein